MQVGRVVLSLIAAAALGIGLIVAFSIGSIQTADLLTPPVFVKTFRGTGVFDEPSSVDHDTLGNIWVSPHDNKIEKFTYDGQLLKTVTHNFSHPHGIAVDRNNGDIVYAGDQNNERVQVFDNNGRFIKCVKNSDMRHIHDVGISKDGMIYVPDYDANHLQKINPDTGAVIWKKTGLSRGWGVHVDSGDYIYLALTGSKELAKLDKNGNVIKKVGGFSDGQGITGVYVDGHDLVYVIETPKKQVQIYDTNLTLKATWDLQAITGGISKPEDITISDDDKSIYVADSVGNLIFYLKRI